MKILHLCKKYRGAMGGDAVVVANLKTQQQLAGHEVVVVTSNCPQIGESHHIYKVGLTDAPANLDKITFKRLLSLVILFFKMFVILRKERPDVMHTHSVDMAFIASFAARFFGIPIIHTFHIITFYDQHQSIIRRKTELWLARHARLHAATAPNKYDVEQLRRAGLKTTVLLSNGVDIEFWSAAAALRKKNTHIFVTIGRLEPQKGYDYLIRAAAHLAETSSIRFRVVIVGEGSARDDLQSLITALGVDHKVCLVGAKSKTQIRALLAGADAFVMPSLYETTPLTLLEAWAAAVPVIATSVGLLRDVPLDFGAAYIIPPKSEYALAKAMHHYIADPHSRDTMAHCGQQEAKKYAWPAIARTAENIYRSAA